MVSLIVQTGLSKTGDSGEGSGPTLLVSTFTQPPVKIRNTKLVRIRQKTSHSPVEDCKQFLCL